MTSLTTAELLDLLVAANSAAEMHFNYWIAITLAVVACRHFICKQPAKWIRIFLTLAYLGIAIIFMIRSANTGINIAMLLLEAMDRGIQWQSSLAFNVSANLQLAIYVLGSGFTAWFLLTDGKRLEND